MSDYRRWRFPGASYFFTVNLFDRRGSLLVSHIDLLRSAMSGVQQCHPYHIDAIVILPEHLHCIWTLPPADDDFSMRWRQIKAEFSRSIPGGEARSPSRARQQERGIWQRRFWEHLLRNEEDFARHVDYIHFNPVKHGYVQRPIDWRWSSLHRYVREGILPADWGTSGISFDLDRD